MKKSILCFLMVIASISIYSYPRHSPVEHAQKLVDILAKRITISQVQKDSLNSAFKTFFESRPHHGQENDKLAALEQARDIKVKSILADEAKFQEYQKFIAELKAKKMNRDKNHEGRKGHGKYGHGKKDRWNNGVSTVPGMK